MTFEQELADAEAEWNALDDAERERIIGTNDPDEYAYSLRGERQ